MKKVLLVTVLTVGCPVVSYAALVTFTCNCGPVGKAQGIEFTTGGTKCTTSSQTGCIVSETTDGFVVRMNSNGVQGHAACDVCGCPETSETQWTSTGISASKRVYTIYDASTYTCNFNTQIKTGCANGYYFVSEGTEGIVCERCPGLYDDWVDCYGESETGNRTGIGGCYITGCANMTDETGTFTIGPNDKCYY